MRTLLIDSMIMSENKIRFSGHKGCVLKNNHIAVFHNLQQMSN